MLKRIEDYIVSFLKIIEKRFKADKVAHFTMGYMIFSLTQVIFLNVTDRKELYTLFGFIIVTIIALLKEIYDERIKHSYFDYKDLFATILGALACYFIY